MTSLYALILSLYLSMPVMAQQAAVSTHKNPLSYSMREYGYILAIAMAGGFIRWHNAVKRGEAAAYDLRGLVGELVTSAFIGILVFWGGEALNWHPLITPAVAGIAGHQGIAALVWAEKLLKGFFERKYGIAPTDRAPLGKD